MSQIPDLDGFLTHIRPVSLAERRDIGFYWVRPRGERWVVAEWLGHGWLVPKAHEILQDDLMSEVREIRLPAPSEKLLPAYMKEVPRTIPSKMADALGRLNDAFGVK